MLSFITASAQDSATIPAPPVKQLTIKPTTDFDQRFSYVDNKLVNIWGYRVGMFINDHFKTGIGGYFFEQQASTIDKNTVTSNIDRKIVFGTLYYEPFIFRREMVEMSLVFEAGYAKVSATTSTGEGETFVAKQSTEHFVPAGAGISFNFKIPEIKHLHFLTYGGINVMAGFRKTVFSSDKTNYDGYYWTIGTAIFIDRIFTDIKAKCKSRRAAKKVIGQ